MSSNTLLSQLTEVIVEGDKEKALATTQAALDAGSDPVEIMQGGVAQGMARIGKMFQDFEVFLPELMRAAEAGKACLDFLLPRMKSGQASQASFGKIVLGTVIGDIHDIGKNLVGAVLASSGFEVYDLGVDTSSDKIIGKALEVNADIIAMSALLTTTMVKQKEVIEELEKEGLRRRVKVMVGGAPVTRDWVNAIGADGFSEDAIGAVTIAKQLMGVE